MACGTVDCCGIKIVATAHAVKAAAAARADHIIKRRGCFLITADGAVSFICRVAPAICCCHLNSATARALVEAGASVVLADLNREAGEKLAAELGAKARFIETDVVNEASAVNAIQTAISVFGGLQGLVNCAGVAPAEKVVGKEGPHRLESFAKTININLVGTFNMIRLAAEAMQKGEPDAGGERGVIVNTASVAAFDGQLGQAAYAASKGVVIGLT